MFKSEHLQEKWAPVLNCEGLDSIKDSYKKAVTAVLLENQESFLREEAGILNEAAPTMSAGTGGFSSASTATGLLDEICILYTLSTLWISSTQSI